MKHLGNKILFTLAVPLICLNLQAQDVRLLSTKVADILAQMPTRDLIQRDRAVEEMISLGTPGINEITKLIVPAGTGDDTNVRLAISALVSVLGQEGKEDARQMVSSALLQAIEQAPDKGVKSYFMNQLRFIAGEEAVEQIAKYLPDDYLVEPTAAVLVSMKNHPAMHALKIAIPELKGKNQVVVVNAFAQYAGPCGEESIRNLAGTTDPQLKKAVLFALSRIGSPASSDIMLKAAKDAGYAYEPTEAARALVTYADNLAKNGELAMALRICNSLVKECQEPANVSTGLAAMSVLTENFGYENLGMLLNSVDNPDKKYREAVLNRALAIQDVSAIRKWMDKAETTNPETAAEIVTMLSQTGNPMIEPLLYNMIRGKEPVARIAALDALVKLEGKGALPLVLKNMDQAEGEELAACGVLLNTIAGPDQMDQVAEAVDKVPDRAKPVLIDLLAARKDASHASVVRGYLQSGNPLVSGAAYKALPRVTKPGDDVVLLTNLENANYPAAIAFAQDALVVAVTGTENAVERNRTIISAYNTKKTLREKLLGVFPRVGGDDALKLVINEFNTQKGSLKDLAFKALTQWKDESVCNELYAIASGKDKKYAGEAFSSYVAITGKSRLNPDQKLLRLRKIMELSSTADQKKQVIQALNGNRTFPTLVFVAKYLDDPAIASDAAWVAMNIALPPSGTREGMYGEVVMPILNKCIDVISGEDSQYAKENMRNWLASMPKDPGFVPMFNGKDLTGWKGLVENPIARAKMSSDELAQKQKAADATIKDSWSVKDGMIVFNGKGNNLCSVKDYADFEMWVDWRITKNGDSGIYLRGSPQVQIWDTSRIDAGAQVGSGGLYNNQKNPSKPLKLADNAIGDWNTFYIKMIGERVTVCLNGILIVDNVIMENYWDRSIPIFPTGAIELQAHGTDLGFRDIYVHEIKSENIGLSVQEQADGFVSLFNGKNLDGWVGNKTDYKVDNGEILVEPGGRGESGNLYTGKEYSDFAFRFEFQLTPGANNGIGIRTPLEGDAAYVGMEIQVLDNSAPVYANLQKYQYHGSVYGVIPARREFLKPVGEWNEEEIWIQGTRIKVILNGTVIVDGDIAEASRNGTIDHNDHPGLKRTSGHIGFLGQGSTLRFRNIRIKTL